MAFWAAPGITLLRDHLHLGFELRFSLEGAGDEAILLGALE
jgi:hypothetical protein